MLADEPMSQWRRRSVSAAIAFDRARRKPQPAGSGITFTDAPWQATGGSRGRRLRRLPAARKDDGLTPFSGHAAVVRSFYPSAVLSGGGRRSRRSGRLSTVPDANGAPGAMVPGCMEQRLLALVAVAVNLIAVAPAFDYGAGVVGVALVVSLAPLQLVFMNDIGLFRVVAATLVVGYLLLGALIWFAGGLALGPGALVLVAALVVPPLRVKPVSHLFFAARALLAWLLLFVALLVLMSW